MNNETAGWIIMARIHIPSLVHRDVTNRWEPDAYIGKILHQCEMLTRFGHTVFLYSGPECDAKVEEHVAVISEADRHGWFGDETWEQTVFNEFDASAPHWKTFNGRIIEAMRERIEPGDLIGLTMGHTHRAIQEAFPNNVSAEIGVGYEGIIDSTHHCFESYAWMHTMYAKRGINDGRFYDVVIPNAFDPADLKFNETKEGYLLFMARLTPRKGMGVVTELAKHFPVITAGQGDERIPGADHVGVVRGKEKAELLAGASALLSPTSYIGPFEGVSVEAMLSGTPAIATPWGCYAETISDGVSGARCHTLAEFMVACEKALNGGFDPVAVRNWATERYTLDAVAPQYDRWLKQLETLYGEGWYEMEQENMSLEGVNV